MNTAVILDQKSAATNATKPVGTGPYKFENWTKGSSVTLVKWDGYRDAAKMKHQESDVPLHQRPVGAGGRRCWPATSTASRASAACRALKQFQSDKRFTVHDRRHRGQDHRWRSTTRRSRSTTCACAARSPTRIDRKAFIDGAQNGLGTPIGSHFDAHRPRLCRPDRHVPATTPRRPRRC